jgi:hypothetical protein
MLRSPASVGSSRQALVAAQGVRFFSNVLPQLCAP